MDKRETNSDHEMEKDNFVNRGEGYLIFKELDINNTVFLKDSELQFTIKEKLFFFLFISLSSVIKSLMYLDSRTSSILLPRSQTFSRTLTFRWQSSCPGSLNVLL